MTTSGASNSRKASMSPAFHASKAALMTSTFSCDIARAVSRLAGTVYKPVTLPAQRHSRTLAVAALAEWVQVVRLHVVKAAAHGASACGAGEHTLPPEL